MTTLTLQLQPQAPLEAAAITPDIFLGKSEREIAGLPVVHGNETCLLGDFFKIEGSGSAEIIVNGDLTRVKNLASGMTQGHVVVNGGAGMHLGAAMRGGVIDAYGSVDAWAGAEMKGGKIHIRGDAGHGLGGAYRGSRHGMNRGLIIVEGNAGHEVGAAMRRGMILVTGGTGDFTGAFMIAGTIVVLGNLGIRAGAGMLRGTIVAFQMPELLPTFRYDCTYQPDFLKLIFQELRTHGLSISDGFATGCYKRYSGDFNRLGKGEILIYDQRK
jgi:formylmethanofuran dehydrogenase subunit C